MRFQRTLIGGGELLAFLRPLWCFIAVISFGQGVGLLPAWAAAAPTITTLSVTSGRNAVATVVSGSVVTLTATVMAGSTPVTPGQVNFCDATAKFCTDIHLLGMAQLTANGTATLKLRPGVGSHSYKAVLAEPAGLGPSASTASSLTVTASQGTGQLATTTYLEAGGVPNIFLLTATVPGNGNTLPTGMVSFQDTSDGNAVLGTAALTTETGFGFAGSSLLPVAPQNISNTVSNTVLAADFNGDGVPDLVVLGSVISVLLGNGDGTFTAAPNPPVDLPGAIAVGDFNGDGIPDVAVAPILDEGYSEVLLGKGDGTFSTGASFGNSNGTVASNSLVAGDFNGDGNLDLAETCDSINEGECVSLLILLGNGDGTFVQSSAIPIPIGGIQSTAVGDFNGDGQLDLAVTDSGGNAVMILLGSGDGTFKATASPATGVGPTSIAVADFNGDGRLDLAVTNSGSNNVTILLGDGDGTFVAAASPATGAAPTSAAVGDFNGDGVPDLAVANAGSSTVTILLGNGDGTFTAAAGTAADTGSTAVSAADFNGDGKEDIVVVNSADRSATALLAETARATATVNNISPAGVGTHLVKAVYSGDVNYGGGTSADASLTVVPPGLTLTGTSVTIASPGTSGTSTITVTPTNGFSGTVTLECDGGNTPGGANDVPTCSSIPPVTISGNAATTTTLSIQTQPGTTPGQYTEAVEAVQAVDSNGAIIAYASVAVTVTASPQSFSLTGTPVSIASPGASGTSTMTVTPMNGFSGTVTLQCIGSTYPSNLTNPPACSPIAPVAISGNAPANTMLSIQTQSGTVPGKYFEAVEAFNSGGIAVAYTRVALTVNAPAPPAGLTLSATPVSVVAGATGTSTLTITPTNGFSGTVTLKCNGGISPGGASDAPACSSIPAVTISRNAATTTTLSIQTQPGTTPGQYMESVNAVDSSGVAMANTTVAVTVTVPAPAPSFALTNTTVSIPTPGASGTSTITIMPSGGFTGSVALSCTVTGPTTAVDLPTCSVAAPPAITGTAAVTATLTVNASAASSSSNATGQEAKAFRNQHNRMLALGGGGALAAFLFFGLPLRRPRARALPSLLLLGAFAAIVMGCGGAQKAANPVTTPANPGTTVGSYMVTVTGSSGALTAATTVAVTVN